MGSDRIIVEEKPRHADARSSKMTCTRWLHFSAGHRVMGHEGHCAFPHGHNYRVELEAEAELDSIGRVVDFSVLKLNVGAWVDSMWDHGFIFHQNDVAVRAMLDSFEGTLLREARGNGAWPDRSKVMESKAAYPCKRFELPYNPTAENLARYLIEAVCPGVLPDGVKVVRVTVHETDNCYATARL